MNKHVGKQGWVLSLPLLLSFGLLAVGAAYSQDDDVIRINADSVSVPVSVLDRSGKYIFDAEAGGF